MTSRERAQEWLDEEHAGGYFEPQLDSDNGGKRDEIKRLAELLDAHAAERVREALERADVEIDARNKASTGHYASVQAYGNALQTIRALLKEVSNG